MGAGAGSCQQNIPLAGRKPIVLRTRAHAGSFRYPQVYSKNLGASGIPPKALNLYATQRVAVLLQRVSSMQSMSNRPVTSVFVLSYQLLKGASPVPSFPQSFLYTIPLRSMRAYSMIHLVVIHLGFTRFRNAPGKTPAGMVPSPAEYLPELPRGVVADTGTYLCICCLLYTSPSPRDKRQSRMPSSA